MISSAGPGLEIKGGGRSSRPLDKAGVGLQKFFFQLFGPQFGLKTRGAGPSPGSATDKDLFSIFSSCREYLALPYLFTIV